MPLAMGFAAGGGRAEALPGGGVMTSSRRLTYLLLTLIGVVFVLTAPAALRRAFERGELYVFSTSLFTDIAPRLTGPGRLRFLLQPLVALLLGIRDGRADARAGRVPYLWALLSGHGSRRALLRDSLGSIANVMLAAILCDAVAQWLIFRAVSPGAALLIGPVLISAPYAVSRALTNRGAGLAAARGKEPLLGGGQKTRVR